MLTEPKSRGQRYFRAAIRYCLLTIALIANLIPVGVLANPSGEQVVSGSASFDRNGNNLNITTSDQVIINWQDFSIGRNETTTFIQPSSSSVALNRVTSGNPSRILGNLNANGSIFLINPNGIVVGEGARIDAGSFLASTLDIADDAFLKGGDLTFAGDSAASIINNGTIRAVTGDVFLVAQNIENNGSLLAPNGTVGLATGNEVLIGHKRDAMNRIFIRPKKGGLKGGTGILNNGLVEAMKVEIQAAGGNPYSLAVSNKGIIRATGSHEQEGRVFLISNGGKIEHSGSIYARNKDGAGGHITFMGDPSEKQETPSTIVITGTVDASSLVPSGENATTTSTLVGGEIVITGDQVIVESDAVINASGYNGGGEILLGGDYQGFNPEVYNAQKTFIGPKARIIADSIETGEGGTIIVWADESTWFYGNLSARGGAQSGDGGFAEISGKINLTFNGNVNLESPTGEEGVLLLDPANIQIISGTLGAGDQDTNLSADNIINSADGDIGTNTLTDAQIEALTGTVTIEATGDITIDTGVSLELMNNTNIVITSTGGSVLFGSSNSITTMGTGAITISAGAAITGGANFTSADGAISLTASGGNIVTGTLTTSGSGGVTLDATSGTISFGEISSGGAVTIDSDTGITLRSNITGTGAVQLINSAVTLGADVQVTGSGITFGSTVDGAQALTITGDATLSGAVGATTSLTGLTISGASSSTVNNVTTTGDISITSDQINLSGASSIAGTTVILTANTASRSIAIGGSAADNAGQLGLSAAEIDVINASSILVIGDASTGEISFSGALAPALSSTLRIHSGGGIIGRAANGNDITITNLELIAAGNIGATNEIESAVNNLVFNSAGNISLENTGSLAINTFTNATNATAVAGGAATLTASSSVTFSVNTSLGGTSTITATESGTPETDNITIGSGVKVATSSGLLTFNAGDNFILTDNTSEVEAPTSITINTAVSDSDDSGSITLNDGTVDATTITLNANSFSGGGGGGVSQSAGGTLSGTNLEINGEGTFDLDSNSNAITTLAGNITSGLTYIDSDGLSVGTVTSTGLTVSAASSITSRSGTLSIDQAITAGSIAVGLNIGNDAAGQLDLNANVTTTGTVTVTGGTLADTINVNTNNSTMSIDGSDGDDVITIGSAAAGLGNINGSITVNGNGGTGDTLTIEDSITATGQTYGTTATNVITRTTNSISVTFSNTETVNLNTSAAADIFNVNHSLGTGVNVDLSGGNDVVNVAENVTLPDSIDGDGDNDTLSFAAWTTVAVSIGLNDFSNFETLTGGSLSDTLTLTTGNDAVSITGANAGTIGTLSFTSFENIDGNGGADSIAGPTTINSWNITGADAGNITAVINFTDIDSLIAGTGTNTFTFGSGASLSGTTGINGGTGTNTLTLSSDNDAIVLSSSDITGTVTGVTSFTNIATLTGGGGTDSLTGRNTANTWTINSADDGTLNSTLTFSNIGALIGGTNTDDFTFGTSGTLSGTTGVTGGGGTNTITLSSNNNSVTLNTDDTTGTITSVATFTGISTLTGGGGTDSLTGRNVTNAWNLTSTNDGTLNGTLTFNDFSGLTGGSDDDTFTNATDGTGWTGTIDGGAQTTADELTYSSWTTNTVIIDGAQLSNIETLTGSNAAGDDILQLTTGTDEVTITSSNVGNVTGGTLSGIAFSNFETIDGVSGTSDTIVLSGTVANTITLTGAFAGDVTGTVAISFTNIDTVNAGDGVDTLVGQNSATAFNITGADTGNITSSISFSAVENLTGGTANDTFTFGSGASLSGTTGINGGTGTNTLTLSSDNDAIVLSSSDTTGTVTGVTSFTNIATLTGGGGTDSLTGRNTANTWTINSADDGTLNSTLNFNNFSTLNGGSGDDTFNVTLDGTEWAGSLNGNSQSTADTLDYSSWTTNSVTITGANLSGIENIVGTSQTGDIFQLTNSADGVTISGANSGSVTSGLLNGTTFSGIENLQGLDGNDTFTLGTSGSLSGSLNGNGGSNTLVGSSSGTSYNITGTNSGTYSLLSGGFTNIHNIEGANASFDTFTFSTTGSLTGTIGIDGGSSTNDRIVLSSNNDAVTLGSDDESGSVTSVTNFTDIEEISGGGGTDSLTGRNATNAWSLSSSSGGTLNSTLTFSNFSTLNGGTADDTFSFLTDGTDWAGTLTGGSQTTSDTLDYSAWTTNTISKTVSTLTSNSIESLTGSSASGDSITLTTGDDEATITAGGTGSITGGSLSGFSFSSIETIDFNGGSNDTFVSSNSLNNTYTMTSTTNVSIAGAFSMSIVDLDILDAGAGTDVLEGISATANTFNVTSSNGGNITGSITFNNIESLTGSTANDSYVFSGSGSLSGSITDSATSTGDTISLASGSGTFSITGANSGTTGFISGTFSNINNLAGGTGNDTFTFGTSGTLSGAIDGGTGNNFLTGNTASTSYNITGTNSGTYSLVSGGFSNIQNLEGTNAAIDTFTFSTGGSLTGTIGIDGGSTGNDRITLSSNNDTVTLGGDDKSGTVTSVTNFTDIEVIIGGSGTDSLTGRNATNSWNLSSSNSGTLNSTLSFINFTNLNGGTGDDTFNLTTDGTNWGGTLDAGIQSTADTLSYSTWTTNNVTLDPNTFSGFENFVGTGAAAGDTFQLTTGTDEVTITSTGAGSVTGGTLSGISFSSFETIDGISGTNDTIVLSGTVANTITLTGANAGDITGTVAISFANMDTVNGGDEADTLVGQNSATAFNITGADTGNLTSSISFLAIENLTGGTADDNFTFSSGASLTGANGINGGSGNNILTLSSDNDAVVLSGSDTAGTVTSVTSFSNISSINGGTGSNTLTGRNVANTWALSTADDGTINSTLSFTDFGALIGGNNTDDFTLATTSTLSGTTGITGSGGNDRITLSSNNDTVTLNTDDTTGTVTSVTAFTGIETINGGGGSDRLTARNATNSWNLSSANDGTLNSTLTFNDFSTITGGSADDTFNLTTDGTNWAGTIDGSTQTTSDTLSYSTWTSVVNASLNSFTNIENIVAGSNTNDTLTLTTGTDSVTITGDQTGTANSTTFSNFENIDGNGGTNDSLGSASLAAVNWNLISATGGEITTSGSQIIFTDFDDLTGSNTGDDTFNLTTDGTNWAGTITAGGQVAEDVLSYSTWTSAVNVNLSDVSGFERIVGGTNSADTFTATTGDDTVIITGNRAGTVNGTAFSAFETVDGNGGADELRSNSTPTTVVFSITTGDGGSITTNGSQIQFTDIDSLTGQATNNTFTFGTTGAMSGILNGGSNGSVFLSTNSDTVNINGSNTGSVTSVINSFTNIQNIDLGGTNVDSISTAGILSNLTWTITDVGDGSISNGTTLITFTDAENLTGGTADDNFTFSTSSAEIVGTINGNTHSSGDTLTFFTDNDTITLTGSNAGTATKVGSFSNIENLTDTGGTDTLIGANTATVWNVTAANGTGNITSGVSFSGIENLTGGTATDTFTFTSPGAITGTLTDTGSTTTLNGSIIANTVNLGVTTLGSNTSIDTSSSNGTINLGTLTGATFDFGVNSGGSGAGDVTIASLSGVGTFTVTDSGGVSITGTAAATTIDLQDTTGTVDFNGAVTATAFTTSNNPFGIHFNAGGTITNTTTLVNDGNIALGNDAADTLNFNGGLDMSGAAGSNTAAGNINTSNTNMILSPLTLTKDTSFNAGTGDISGSTITGGSNTTTFSGDEISLTNVTGVTDFTSTTTTSTTLTSVSATGDITLNGLLVLGNSLVTTDSVDTAVAIELDAVNFTGGGTRNIQTSGGQINISGVIDGGGTEDLTVTVGSSTASSITYGGDITDLDTFTSTALAIVVGNATTADTQTYNGTTTLTGDLTTTATASTFGISMDALVLSGGDRQITTSGNDILISGNVTGGGNALTLNGTTAATSAILIVGDATGLSTFNATSSSTFVNNVTTTGAQTYQGFTRVSGGDTLTGTTLTFRGAGAVRGSTSATTKANINADTVVLDSKVEDVYLSETNGINIQGTTTADIFLETLSGNITQTAALTANQINFTSAGNITLTQANTINELGDITTGNGNSFSLTNGTALVINGQVGDDSGTNTTSSITINNTGAITHSSGEVAGTTLILQGAGQAGASGTAVITEITNLTINKASGDVFISEVDALNINASSVGTGGLNISANGITQAGAITQSAGAANSTFNGGTTGITLTSGNEFVGSVALFTTAGSGASASVTDVTAIDLAASDIDGNLTVAANGDITDSGNLIVDGNISLDTNTTGNITLDSTGNAFTGTFSLNGSSANNLGGTLTIVDTTAFDYGTLTANGVVSITAAGITQTGGWTVSGGNAANFTAGSNVITLTQSNDFTGDVNLSNSGANDVSVTDANAIVLGTVNVGSGNLNITGVGITQSGTITMASAASGGTFDSGAGVLTLDQANDFEGTINLSNSGANNVQINENNGSLSLGTVNVGTGTFTATATTGISIPAVVTQTAGAGAFTLNSGTGAVSVTNSSNSITGDVILNNTATANSTFTNGSATSIGTSSIGSGSISFSSGGTITQTGSFTAPGTARFAITGGAGDINLTNAANDFATLRLTNTVGNASVTESNDLILGNSSISGTLTLNVPAGTITQSSNISAGTITIPSSGGVITLNNTSNNISNVGNITRAGDLYIENGNAITVSGTINGTGSVTIYSRGGGKFTIASGAQIVSASEVRIGGEGDFEFTGAPSGTAPFNMSSGARWIIYTATRAGASPSGLVDQIPAGLANFQQFSTNLGGSPLAAGNGVIFQESFSAGGGPGPTIPVTPTPFEPLPTATDISLPAINVNINVDVFESIQAAFNSIADFDLDVTGLNGISAEDIRNQLRELISEEQRDDLQRALNLMETGVGDAREMDLPVGMVYFQDSEGNSIVISYDLLISLMQLILTDEEKENINFGDYLNMVPPVQPQPEQLQE